MQLRFLLILMFCGQLIEPARGQQSVASTIESTTTDAKFDAARARRINHPPDILGPSVRKTKIEPPNINGFQTKISHRDITLIEIEAPPIATPAKLPPFPERIDLDVHLLKPSHASEKSTAPREILYRDIDGMVASSPLPMPYYHHSATAGDAIAVEALNAERMRNSGAVKEAFEKYAAIVKVRRSNLSVEEQVDLAKCHKALGEILYTYGRHAINANRLKVGKVRLLSSWIEYKRALFLNSDDKQIQSQLLVISKYAVEQNPSFVNWLAYGSSFMLSGDVAKAKECYRQCRRLDPDAKILKRLPL